MKQKSTKLNWEAEWICYRDAFTPYHFFLFVRNTFEISEEWQKTSPQNAVIHITASSRYRLFVNGQYLGRGPARCDPRWQSYDTHNIANLLHPGKNVIAIQTYYYGCKTGFARDDCAGLLAQLEILKPNGRKEIIGTGPGWKVRPGQGWRRDAKQVNSWIGVTEVYDTRLDPDDWMQEDYNDSEWEPAAILPREKLVWCSQPEARDIPMLREEEVFPVKVIRVGECLAQYHVRNAVDIPEILAREIHEDLQYARFDNSEAVLSHKDSTATVNISEHTRGTDVTEGIREPFILLDFGREVNAFPRICIEGQSGGIVDFTYGELLIGGRIAPLICQTRSGDRYIMRDGLQTWEAFEYKSFRYLQATFRNLSKPVKLHFISANTFSYPAKVRGHFECPDEMLTKLWKACVATTDLCTDDAYMDTPYREKRNWLGDGSHALLGTYAAFGDTAMVRRYFRLTRRAGLGDGLLRMYFPGSDYYLDNSSTIKVIPQHSLVWAVRTREYYDYFGDTGFLEEMYPVLEQLAGWCERFANSTGLMENLPYWNWLDWTASDLRGANFGINAFYYKMLDDMSFIAAKLEKHGEADRWREKASTVQSSLKSLFWNDDKGLFEDSFFKGALTGIASELANGLALLYEIAESEQKERIVTALRDDKSGLAPVTPLFFHYLLMGLCGSDHTDFALELIRKRFGPMMSLSDTIWEGWNRFTVVRPLPTTHVTPADLGEARLDNHPAAFTLAHCGGVPVSFVLLTEILGIKPEGSGFRRCILKPRIDLLPSAKGVFPSGRGDIAVSWKTDGNLLSMDVDLPKGLEADLRPIGNEYTNLQIDDRTLSLKPGEPLDESVRRENDQLVIKLKPGRHHIRLNR